MPDALTARRLLIAVVKLPPAREEFVLQMRGVERISAKHVYDVCVAMSKNLAGGDQYDDMVEATSSIGGPLKKHWLLAQMEHRQIFAQG